VDRLEDGPGALEAVRLPGVLAQQQHDLGVLVVARRVRAVQRLVDEELAALLLGQRQRAELRPETGVERQAVRPAEVVPLPAGAVVEDRLAAVTVDDALDTGGHLGDGRVPVDLLVRPVRPAAQRRRQAVPAVLVVVEAQRLLAGVALRGRVRLVAPDPFETAPVLTPLADLDAAVDVAEDAGGLLPVLHARLLQCAMSRCQLFFRPEASS
jgi:hypothetical protein